MTAQGNHGSGGPGTRNSGAAYADRVDRIGAAFARCRSAGRTALIPFVTAGDPLPQASIALMHALVESGADLIELGMPFSDPMADGPVIQHADERALRHHVGIQDILGWVQGFRQQDQATPIILMGYLNPIEIHGVERFAREAVAAGVDGVLVVDCPIEEDATLQPLRAEGLRRILLVAPTTSPVRRSAAAARAEGYIYYVSFAGVTGAARLAVDDVQRHVAELRDAASLPIAVGFGIRDATSARAVAAFADAVVVGSGLVAALEGAADADDVRQRALVFLGPLRAAIDAKRT